MAPFRRGFRGRAWARAERVSVDAFVWVMEQAIPRSSDKLVALALAYKVPRNSNVAFLSVASLAEMTSLNEKTIPPAIDRLEAAGIISDTGQRAINGRVTVWRFPIPAKSNSPKNGGNERRNSSDQLPHDSPQHLPQDLPQNRGSNRDRHTSKDVRDRERLTLSEHVSLQLSGKAADKARHWTADQVETVEAKFRNYHIAKGSGPNTPAGWNAAWENWVLIERDVAPDDGTVNPIVRAVLSFKAEREADFAKIAGPFARKSSDVPF